MTPYRSRAPNHESDSSLIAGRYLFTFVPNSGIDHMFEVVEYGRTRSWFGLVVGPLVEERRYTVRGTFGSWAYSDGYQAPADVRVHLNAALTRHKWKVEAGG